MEVFVLSRQSCECCLAHRQHHQLPTWSRRQVLALRNYHFPPSLVMMELYYKLPFPSGPVRHPGLRRILGRLNVWSQLLSLCGGKDGVCIAASCLCGRSQLFPGCFFFFRKPFLPGDRTVEHKKQLRRHCHWQLRLKAGDLIIVRERYP